MAVFKYRNSRSRLVHDLLCQLVRQKVFKWLRVFFYILNAARSDLYTVHGLQIEQFRVWLQAIRKHDLISRKIYTTTFFSWNDVRTAVADILDYFSREHGYIDCIKKVRADLQAIFARIETENESSELI